MCKEQHLFVYGTLQPGKPNAHWLERIGGRWQAAHVRGHLHEDGWGATMGYPAVKLDPSGPRINGYVFSSCKLIHHWTRLDEFEGDVYRRTTTRAELENGDTVRVQIYELAPAS